MGQISFENNPRQQEGLAVMLTHTFSMLYGGSRSGKTFVIMFFVLFRALKKKSRHLVLRRYFSDIKKSIIKETLPEVAEIMGCNYKLNSQDFYITFPNGSEIWFGGVDDKQNVEKLLGKQYSTIWFNEASQIAYDSYSVVKTRLAEKSGLKNRIIIDQNPPRKSHWTFQLFFKKIEPEDKTLLKNPEKYGQIQMNPADNMKNINEEYLEMLEGLPAKQRKRFLHGEFSEDEIGALFTESNFNKNRVDKYPELKKIVIAVDPAVTAKMTSDETGIAAAGIGFDGRGYLLEDASGIFTPKEWSTKVARLYKKWDADIVVGECNQGGDLVKHTIQTADENIPVKLVHATKGKLLRSEPISAIYEDDRISHVGGFPDAEEEMCNYTGEPGEKSPNRLDAITYAFTELFPVGVYSNSEIFNRDNIKHFKDYDFTNSHDFVYIKIYNNARTGNYNFAALYARIKDKKIFITDCIFNTLMPHENLDQVKNKLVGLNVKRIFVECDVTFVHFARQLKIDGVQVRNVREMRKEDNMVISESGFIKECVVFEKNPDSIYYKNFLQQLYSYTSISESDSSYAANITAGVSYASRKMYKRYLE